ncbi:MAG: MFS transporter [Anaerolineae bacterium]|jgi:FHS family Na+ dependent glucose MFS transporter 1
MPSTHLLSQPTNRDWLLKTAGYYAAFIILGLASAAIGPTLPALAAQTGSKLGEISFLFTTHALGYLIGSFQGGRVYDRLSGHHVMGLGLLLIAVALAMAPVVPLLWLLTLVIGLLGLAQGLVDVGGNTLLVWVHRDRVGPFMNGLHFFYGLGGFVSPMIVAWMISISDDITWAYWILALLALPPAVWLIRLPSPSTRAPAPSESANPVSPWLVPLIALFFTLYVGAETSLGGWIYTYAVSLGLGNATTAAYLTSGFWGAFTAGRLLSIPLAARLRPRSLLILDFGGAIASLGVLLLWPTSTLAAWVGTLGVGAFIASVFPTMISMAERRMVITGRVTGWFFVGASIGGMSLPWLIGQLFESIGPRVTMSVILIDLLVAAGILVALALVPARVERE